MTVISHAGQRHRFTVDEYLRMAETGILRERDRVELIEGEVLDMGPKGPRHAGVVTGLVDHLNRGLGRERCVWSQFPLRLNDLSLPEPDVAVLRGRPNDYTDAYPSAADVLLLIEVSDASQALDRGDKAFLYARHGIPEYWVVDLATREVVTHRDPAPSGYRTVHGRGCREEWVSAVIPSVRVRGEDVLG